MIHADHDDRLAEDVLRRPEEARNVLGRTPEGVAPERRREVLVLPVEAQVIPLTHAPGFSTDRPFPRLHWERSGR
jgi:hypothetical protein